VSVRHDDHWLAGRYGFRQGADTALVNHSATASEQEIMWGPGHRDDLVIIPRDICVRAGKQDCAPAKLARCRRAHVVKVPWLIHRGRPKREDNWRLALCQEFDKFRQKVPGWISQEGKAGYPGGGWPVCLGLAQNAWEDAQRQELRMLSLKQRVLRTGGKPEFLPKMVPVVHPGQGQSSGATQHRAARRLPTGAHDRSHCRWTNDRRLARREVAHRLHHGGYPRHSVKFSRQAPPSYQYVGNNCAGASGSFDHVSRRFTQTRHEHLAKKLCGALASSDPVQEVWVWLSRIPVGTDGHEGQPKLCDPVAIGLTGGNDHRLTAAFERKAYGQKWLQIAWGTIGSK
jgi:hypothetical protein